MSEADIVGFMRQKRDTCCAGHPQMRKYYFGAMTFVAVGKGWIG